MKKRQSPVSRSGRFASSPSAEVAAFTESISFDWRLWEQDIQGSIAHATMLQSIGVLTRKELADIRKGLIAIGEEILEGRFAWNPDLEDVHMNIEAALTQRVPAGAKLHTGRSRNDQVALDMRLWLREQIVFLGEDLRAMQKALWQLAHAHGTVIIPGYTHLQRAQPVYFAHHLLAYVEMLERDHGRLEDCFHRVNVCPLGSGALAGSTLPLDRVQVAELLGFVDARGKPQITQNSMDAVSDRDFVVEFCSATALLAVHLSRLSEDVVLWASEEFGFIRIGDAYTTGSSLMPQKKNPDLAELARGKSGRMIGNLMSLLTVLKGLPMTYNRDLQEDKERLFDSADTARSTVRILTAMLEHTEILPEACARASADAALLATDLADYLVEKGMPFRQAHHVIGDLVGLAESRQQSLDDLALKDLQSITPLFEKDVSRVLKLKTAMTRRKLPGAPGEREVKKQLKRWEAVLFPDSASRPSRARARKASKKR